MNDIVAQNNPYAPPATDEPATKEGATTRSRSPQVYGILSIIFAPLYFLFGLLMILLYRELWLAGEPLLMSIGLDRGQENIADPSMVALVKSLDGVYVTSWGLTILGSLLSLGLLALGIGLVKYWGWARRGAVLWSIVALGDEACSTAWGILAQKPLLAKSTQVIKSKLEWESLDFGQRGFANLGAESDFFWTIGLSVVMMVFPALLLVTLSREAVKKDMR